MLDQLLSSKPKSKLVNLLLAHPKRAFSATELKVSCGISNQLLKKTLRELTKNEFVLVSDKKKHKYFQVNRHFPLYPELLNVLRKNKTVPIDLLAKASTKVGECKLIAITGVFAGKPRIETDILFVGRVSPRKLASFLKLAEKFAEQEVSYTVFTNAEYEYRQVMNDRFVKNILENDPVIVIDKTKTRTTANFR